MATLYGATTNRATDQSRSSLGMCIAWEKTSFPCPSSFFTASTLNSSTLLIALEFASKKTYSSTHLKIPFLDWILYLRSPRLDIQCLPSKRIISSRGKEFWDALDPHNTKQVLEAVKEVVRLNVRLVIQDLISAQN